MVMVDNCCGCFSLKTGTIIIAVCAVLQSIFGNGSDLAIGYSDNSNDSNDSNNSNDDDSTTTVLLLVYISIIIVMICRIVSSILLLIGVLADSPNLVIQFVWFGVFLVALDFILCILSIVVGLLLVYVIIIKILVYAIFAYFLIVVYSFYKKCQVSDDDDNRI